MKAESVAFAVAGMCFGIILGWVLATQDANRAPTSPAAAPAAAPAATGQRPPATLDETRVKALQAAIQQDPRNADNHAQLGNTYFDAEQWTNAYTLSLHDALPI